MIFVEKDEISSGFEHDKAEISTSFQYTEKGRLLNCKTNVVVYFPSVRYHWTKSKQNDNNNAYILLCLQVALQHCCVASHFLSIKLIVAKETERLTTTTTSTHKIDPKYVTCFENYVKADTRCPPSILSIASTAKRRN